MPFLTMVSQLPPPADPGRYASRSSGLVGSDMGNFWLTLFLTSFCATSFAQDRISPMESNARLHGVTSDHAVWVTSELDPATSGHVAAKYTHRIYLQKLDENTAKLFHSFRGSRVGACSASKSGSLIFTNGNSGLSWHAPDGSLEHEPVLFGKFDLYSDGLVLRLRPDCYFVPFANHRVDLASRVTLKNAGSSPSLGLPDVDVVRHDNCLAWVGEKTAMENLTTQPLNLSPKRSKQDRKTPQYAIYTYSIEKRRTLTTNLGQIKVSGTFSMQREVSSHKSRLYSPVKKGS